MTERSLPVPGGRLLVVDAGAADHPAIHLLHAGIAGPRPEAPDRLATLVIEFLPSWPRCS